MPSNFDNLVVTWYDNSDNYATNAIITSDVKALPLFTDTGTGEVNQARIILRSLDGNYIVSGNQIDIHDRFRIQIDDKSSNSYDRYFEVVDIIPSQSKAEGSILTLECLGIEYHTQHIHMSKPFYFTNAFAVADDIGDYYNENKGSNQPALTRHDTVWNGTDGNNLPSYTANNYEYGLNEETVYNRWIDVVDKMGASVAAGGALTFYELSFDTSAVNAIEAKIRATGSNTTIKTIKNAKVTDPKTVGEQEGQLSIPTGSNVLAWGSADHGTLPVDFSKYDSQLIQFLFRPEYDNTAIYKTGAKIKVTNADGTAEHFESLHDDTSACTHTPPTRSIGSQTSDTNWSQIDMKSEFGDSIQYSPWTDDKAVLWSNSGADPKRSGFTNGGFFDINLVVWDDAFFRTWVDAVAANNAGLDALAATAGDGYSYDGTRTGFPRGFRVLVDSDVPTGDLANFSNMVAEWDGSQWVKKYSFDSNNDKVQVAAIHNAKIYEYDHATTNFTDISGSAWANDCFHPYDSVPTNVNGVDLVNGTPRSEITDATNYPQITDTTGQSFTKSVDSGIQFKTTSGALSSLTDVTGQTSDYYKNTCGFCIRFPFPNNNFNAVSEGVGDLYGGGTNSKTEPATLDMQNMHLTHDGKRGFNQGSSSEDLGQISAVAFWAKFSLTIGGNELNDEHRFRAFMIDSSDNVVYQDFVIEFSNTWQDVILPISGFQIYRGRKPVYGFDAVIANFVPPKELEIVNIFEWRNVKMFGVQYQSVYDKFGRFNPGNAIINENGNSVTFAQTFGATRTLTMDGFRFIKPLLVTSGQESTMNLEPTFLQRPNITVYDQLLNDAKSQLEIEKFRHKEYDITTSGDSMFDVKFGESFYLENDEIISDSDNGANTIKLVAKRIEYSLTKPPNGAGGLRRRIQGSKVFT